MNNRLSTNRVWGSALVCLALCFFSIFAFAQERKSEPPQETQSQENKTSTLEFQKPDKIIIKEQNAGDPDRPVIKGKVPNPEPRASGYLKLGDIKGESAPEAQQTMPAHTPEWTNDRTGDPGVADDRHKDWINLDSVSLGKTKAGQKIKAPDSTPRYECGQEGGECHCSGVLDCKNLWSSGECKPNTEWEDGNDNSKGGCIEN